MLEWCCQSSPAKGGQWSTLHISVSLLNERKFDFRLIFLMQFRMKFTFFDLFAHKFTSVDAFCDQH